MEVDQFYAAASRATSAAFSRVSHPIVHDLEMAGLILRLRFAGDRLLPFILPAFSHAIIPESDRQPDYSVDIWDSDSTGTPLPPAPCHLDDILARGELRGLRSDRHETAYHTHARMLSLVDHEAQTGIVCFGTSRSIPAFEWACPLRGILSWILRRKGIAMIHAAAVGTPDGALLIAGNSGAGKSSTALRCLAGGLHYYGDDLCAVSPLDSHAQVHCVYSSGKTYRRDEPYFPELAACIRDHREEEYEKSIYFFANIMPRIPGNTGMIRGVVVPQQDPSMPLGITRMSIARVLSIVASSTRTLLPDAGTEVNRILSRVFHTTPCFQLNLGNDRQKLPEAIRHCLADLTQQSATSHA